MELLLHPKDCCNPIAPLLLGVIFHALLTSLVNRHINVSFFSSLLKHFKEKAQQIKDAVIEAKRVAAQLQLIMAGQLDCWANHNLAEANESHENHPGK